MVFLLRLISLEYVIKPVGGAVIGVSIPLIVEYGAKGKRLMDKVKYSGLVGVAEGIIGIGAAAGSEAGWYLRGMKDEDKALLAALGGAGLATGVSIIILDELRKRALYEFRKGGRVPREIPLVDEGFPRMQERYPTAELVEEI